MLCRYSDFLVREIASNGETVRLTTFDPPASGVAVGDENAAKLEDVFSSAEIDKLRKISSPDLAKDNADYVEIPVYIYGAFIIHISLEHCV